MRPLITRTLISPTLVVLAVLVFVCASARADDVEVVIPVTINEVSQGQTAAVITGPDIFVPLQLLQRSGVGGEAWRRALLVAAVNVPERQIQNEPAVSLLSLAPAVGFKVDESALTLSIVVDPRLIRPQSLTVGSARPEGILYSNDSSAFLNYAVTGQRSHVSGYGEVGMSIRRNLLYTSFSRTPDAGYVRGLTSLSRDDARSLRRWTLGDSAVSSDELGGSGLIGGVTVARQFGIDPYFVRYPVLSLRGMATTPSQVDVYMNGVLVSRQAVAPGPFEIANVPAVAGNSRAQIVIRDAFGREQTQGSSFYYSTAVLGKGVSDFVYSAGALRDTAAAENFKYGATTVVAAHRYGLTDRTTIGGRLEATRELVSGGPSLSFASALGEFDLKVAASSTRSSQHGAAAQVAFRKLARRANLSVVVRSVSRDYSNFSLSPSQDRPLTQSVVSASVLPRWGNLSLQWAVTRMRDTADQNRLSLLSSLPIARNGDLMLTASSVRDGMGNRHAEYSLGLSVHGAARTTINVSALGAADTHTLAASVQRSVGIGEGFGYRLQTESTSGETNGIADVEYQGRYGRYDVQTPLRDRQLTASVSGALVYEGGRLMATRAVSQSFAVVRIPGIAGVRVYLSNQLVGRTDANGDLLLPEMLSYYGNRVRIDDRDIPMTYDVQTIEKTIAPPNRGGALILFEVNSVRSVTGSVSVGAAADRASAAYGQITLKRPSGDVISPLGATGDFYFENVSPGTYPAVVDYEKGACSFSLKIPESPETTINLGRVVCTGTAKP